jgi:hypothetical protein
MELLNWMDSCYAQEQAKNSRPVSFDLIDKVFKEVGYIKNHNKCMAEIVKLFDEALKKPNVGIDAYCYTGAVDGLWEDYVENITLEDDIFNQKFDTQEDWIDDAFFNCFANWFITILNTNLGSHPSPNSSEWHDGRYAYNSIWHNNKIDLSKSNFF